MKKIVNKIKDTSLYQNIINNGIIKNSIITLSSQTIAGAISFLQL